MSEIIKVQADETGLRGRALTQTNDIGKTKVYDSFNSEWYDLTEKIEANSVFEAELVWQFFNDHLQRWAILPDKRKAAYDNLYTIFVSQFGETPTRKAYKSIKQKEEISYNPIINYPTLPFDLVVSDITKNSKLVELVSVERAYNKTPIEEMLDTLFGYRDKQPIKADGEKVEQDMIWNEIEKSNFIKPFDYNPVETSISEKMVENNGWISVGEGLPEDSQDVLCTDNFTCYAVGWYADDYFFNDKVMRVTHWMSLPKPSLT